VGAAAAAAAAAAESYIQFGDGGAAASGGDGGACDEQQQQSEPSAASSVDSLAAVAATLDVSTVEGAGADTGIAAAVVAVAAAEQSDAAMADAEASEGVFISNQPWGAEAPDPDLGADWQPQEQASEGAVTDDDGALSEGQGPQGEEVYTEDEMAAAGELSAGASSVVYGVAGHHSFAAGLVSPGSSEGSVF
jgi:hypothetical protein